MLAAWWMLALADLERLRERLDHALGDQPRRGLVAFLAQHGELVAAEARQRVALAQAALQPAGHLHQHLVAGGVAEAVVDRFEGVEVDVDNPEAAALAPRRGDPDAVREQHPVGQAGERVVQGLVGEPLLLPLALGDVLDLGDQVDQLPPLVADRRDVDRGPDMVALGVQVPLLGPVAEALAGDDLAHRLDAGVDVIGVGDLSERGAEQPVRVVGEQLAEGGVDPGELALGGDQGHADAVVLEGAAEALLGLLQGAFGTLALADVVHEQVEDPAPLDPDRRQGQLDRQLRTIPSNSPRLHPLPHDRPLAGLVEALQQRLRPTRGPLRGSGS